MNCSRFDLYQPSLAVVFLIFLMKVESHRKLEIKRINTFRSIGFAFFLIFLLSSYFLLKIAALRNIYFFFPLTS